MPLTDKQIKAIQPEDKTKRYFDGKGLYLEVSPKGGKWWRFKYTVAGKEKRISLGVYPEVTLKEAREKAEEAKKSLKNGIDPSFQKRRASQQMGMTFEAVAREWYDKQKGAVTEKTWENNDSRLRRLVFPLIGKAAIAEIKPPDILALCRKIEKGGRTYQAHTILGLCSRAFRYAVSCGYVDSDPCRDLEGALAPHSAKKTPTFTRRQDIKRLLLAIDAYEGHFGTQCALKLLPLLFVRQGELRQAEWSEFDFSGAEWRIPAHRMKMRDEHIVPLSRQSLAILAELKDFTGHRRFLFPSLRTEDRCMSDNTINSALCYMGFSKQEIKGHGFRAMASTLLNELGWPPDVIERQLAHAERNKVRAAYNRALYMDERRKMMQAWADHLDDIKKS